MSHIPLKRKEDIGLSPYELKFRGRHRSAKVEMSLLDIDAEEVSEFTINSSVDALQPYKNSETLSWLNIDGLHNEALMLNLQNNLQIPADILSDVMEPDTRPKFEEFDDGVFISLKMMRMDDRSKSIVVDNLSLVVMDHLLVSFQEEKNDLFNPVRDRIHKHAPRFHSLGPDYLAFALLDVVIDNYIFILGGFGEKIEDLENNIMQNIDKKMLEEINLLKRQLGDLGRNIRPARDMIIALSKSDSDFVTPPNEKHYKELQDNIYQVVELLDYYRELLYDQLNIYHSSMSTKLNDIMALLTLFSVIFIPISFIAGLYGMNFDNMPGTQWRYGYFTVCGIMIVIAAVMLRYFKKKKWF